MYYRYFAYCAVINLLEKILSHIDNIFDKTRDNIILTTSNSN